MTQFPTEQINSEQIYRALLPIVRPIISIAKTIILLLFLADWRQPITIKHGFSGFLMWLFAFAFLKEILNGYGFDGNTLMRGFTVVGMSMFLITIFKLLFNTKEKLSTMLSRYSYAAYVIQMIPLAIITSIYKSHMAQTPLINFVAIAMPSIIFSFIFAGLICKTPVLKRIF